MARVYWSGNMHTICYLITLNAIWRNFNTNVGYRLFLSLVWNLAYMHYILEVQYFIEMPPYVMFDWLFYFPFALQLRAPKVAVKPGRLAWGCQVSCQRPVFPQHCSRISAICLWQSWRTPFRIFWIWMLGVFQKWTSRINPWQTWARYFLENIRNVFLKKE